MKRWNSRLKRFTDQKSLVNLKRITCCSKTEREGGQRTIKTKRKVRAWAKETKGERREGALKVMREGRERAKEVVRERGERVKDQGGSWEETIVAGIKEEGDWG